MKKKQFVYVSMAATALASCMTSCIENEEGEGLKALREGQSEYWIAKGEAEKTLANADLKRAEGEAALNAAKAKVEEAAAKAKEAAIALTEAEAKAKQIENDYNEKMNALDVALASAQNEADIAKVKNEIELEAEKHKIAMDALEQTRVANEKALVAAQATLVAQKEAYEEAILKAETDLATAKKNQATSMASIENELAKLEETKRGYEIQLEKLKITNDGLELDNERLQENLELRKATEALTTEINKVNQELTMYNSVIAKIDAAYATYVTAQKDLIDKNATYAQAVDTYSLAIINALNADIDNENTKALAVYNKEKAIKTAEYNLLVSKRSLVSYEVAIESAEKALAKFQETEKADKEALAESIADVKEEIEQLKKDQAAKQVEIDQAIIAKEAAYDELLAADDKLTNDLNEKIEAIQKAVWALDDSKPVNGDYADGDEYYSTAEVLADELQAARDKYAKYPIYWGGELGEEYAAAKEAYDKTIAELDEQKDALDEEIEALEDEQDKIDDDITAAYEALQEKFVGLSDKLVKLNDEKMQWNDAKVKNFQLTVGETIAEDVATWIEENGNALDVNGQQYFNVVDGKLVMAKAYDEWLINAALVANSDSYYYNYQIDGKYDDKNNYAEAYVAKKGENYHGVGSYESYTFPQNYWQPQNFFDKNPIYALSQRLDERVSYHKAMYESADYDRVWAAYYINVKGNELDPSIALDAYNLSKMTFDAKKLKVSQDKITAELADIKTNNPDTWNDDTTPEGLNYKNLNELLTNFSTANASYNTNLNKNAEYSAADTELLKFIEEAMDAYQDILDKIAEADTEMGIAFKNIVDAEATKLAALNEQWNVKQESIDEKKEAKDEIDNVDKVEAAKVKTDAEKAADKAMAAAQKENDEKVAENEKAIKELLKGVAEAQVEYAKAYAALEELAAYEEAKKAKDEVSAEMTDIDNNLKYAKALSAALAKVYGWEDYSEYDYLVGGYAAQDAETIEQAIAAEERGLKEAIEDAERDLEVATQTVESKEQALKTAQDDLTKTLNSNEYEEEYDAVAMAEDTLAKAKLDLEAAERTFEEAEAVYNAAIEAWNALLPDAE